MSFFNCYLPINIYLFHVEMFFLYFLFFHKTNILNSLFLFLVSFQPDPRMCHESLLDQIKKGATLKRNRTVNDRSAPKIL